MQLSCKKNGTASQSGEHTASDQTHGRRGHLTETIFVVGAGQAAAEAIDTLLREDFSGRVVLIGAALRDDQ
jgi:hypothetical protein